MAARTFIQFCTYIDGVIQTIGNSTVWVSDISNGTANRVLGTDSGGNGTTLTLGGNLTRSGTTLDAKVAPPIGNVTNTLGNVSLIRASGDLTAQSANAAICSYTPAANGTFRVGAYATIKTVATDVLQIQTTYTDETSTARTVVSYPMGATSVALSATGVYAFPDFTIRAKSGTAIVVSGNLTTGTGSISYDAGATIEQLR